ncbi:MAG: large-conductance mechanosensitive channel protein MscL [Bacteroidales bacterium]|nr:large-conductance mechanosensitive channel protein MscL [Bacteroidales bacterium]
MKKFFNEFKEFAMRGNVVDMAVGVIIGGAFGKIVTSLVNDIIMPGIGVLTGGANFSEFKFVLQKQVLDGATQEVITPEVAITWGAFVQTIVDFLIIAFCIFLAIKVMNKFMRKKAEEPAPEPAPAEPTKEEQLLTEIRDLLKDNAKKQ